jgi:hypothetical protein
MPGRLRRGSTHACSWMVGQAIQITTRQMTEGLCAINAICLSYLLSSAERLMHQSGIAQVQSSVEIIIVRVFAECVLAR